MKQLRQRKSANSKSTSFAGELGEPDCRDIDLKKMATLNHPLPQPRIYTYDTLNGRTPKNIACKHPVKACPYTYGDASTAEKTVHFSTFLTHYYRYDNIHAPHAITRQETTYNTLRTDPSSLKTQTPKALLTYYGYRYANSPVRHWPSRDPIRERGGVNIYSFGPNDPYSGADILGRDWIKWRDIEDLLADKLGDTPDFVDDQLEVVDFVVSEADKLTDKLKDLGLTPCQIIDKIKTFPAVSCSCTVLGVLDISFNIATNPVVEIGDCVCQLLQSASNACKFGAFSHKALAQTLLAMADCGSINIASIIAGLTSGGNPFAAAAVTAVAEPIVDGGIWVAQNLINEGSPIPVEGICDCIIFLREFNIPIE